jgi:hypothetical protein
MIPTRCAGNSLKNAIVGYSIPIVVPPGRNGMTSRIQGRDSQQRPCNDCHA